MSVILILVGFSLMIAVVGLVVFFWSVRSGQYDDPYGSSVRMLFDDEKPDETGVTVPGPGDNANPTNQT
jgi:cbb3-type cytochrome oxidase maturation protein